MEPTDPNGPLPFTSTTLLSLAYIRNCLNFGSARALLSWDPVQIATSLRNVPPLNRNKNALLAALHSTHVLGTLVKLGVEYIRNTQAFTWGIEDALCGLECAIFLNKWILGIGETIHKRPLWYVSSLTPFSTLNVYITELSALILLSAATMVQ